MPVCRWLINSATPPTSVAITGKAERMASIIVSGKPSHLLIKAKDPLVPLNLEYPIVRENVRDPPCPCGVQDCADPDHHRPHKVKRPVTIKAAP